MPANRRPKLPKVIRDKLQFAFRQFVFLGLTWIICWSFYTNMKELRTFGDVTKAYGFNPGRRL